MTIGIMKQPLASNFQADGIKVNYTSSFYFKKYYFKILYNFSNTLEDLLCPLTNGHGHYYSNYSTKGWNTRSIATRKLIKEVVKDFKEMYPTMDLKFRTEFNCLSVFVTTPDDFVVISNHHRNEIESVYMPVNETQITMMDDLGASIVFKKKLFKDKYRYKLSVYATSEMKSVIKAIDNINQELTEDDFLGSANYFATIIGAKVNSWNLISMYYNDPKDIMIIRFILGDITHKIEKCSLYSEIS